jgi:ubiquinone/menaquinone biosynthesis C-methylase UbiE
MSFFAWTAPLFKLASRRWSQDDFQALADHLREHVTGERPLLDLGGGTGEVGTGVASSLGIPVIVADATRQMLARVSAAPHVSVSLVEAEALPFPRGHFDALLCCDAFHHFRDQGAVAAEMARVVRPGGAILILDMEANGLINLARFIEHMLGEPAAFLSGPEMVALMAAHRVRGTVTRLGGSSFMFLGSVAES